MTKKRALQKAPAPEPFTVTWQAQAALTATSTREGTLFVAVLNPVGGHWNAAGFCTPAPNPDAVEESRLLSVLEQHAHTVIVVNASLSDAMLLAEKFVLTAPVPSERCACPEMAPSSAPAPRPRSRKKRP